VADDCRENQAAPIVGGCGSTSTPQLLGTVMPPTLRTAGAFVRKLVVSDDASRRLRLSGLPTATMEGRPSSATSSLPGRERWIYVAPRCAFGVYDLLPAAPASTGRTPMRVGNPNRPLAEPAKC